MEQQEIELAVLAGIRSLEDLATLRKSFISSQSFVYAPQAFSFLESHVREHHSVPSRELVEKACELQLPVETVEGDREFYIKQLAERELTRKAQSVLERGIGLLAEHPTDAVTFLVGELVKLRRHRQLSKSLTDGQALMRLEGYLERREKRKTGVRIGLRTGLSVFDEEELGLAPGNMLGLIGNTSVGKSWLLEFIAVTAYLQDGARVLFVSPEMTVAEVEGRWDTIVGHLLGMELSNLELARGGKIDLEQYKSLLEAVQQRQDWLTCSVSDLGTPFTISAIEDLASEFRPDVLAVDGLPLLGAENAARNTAQWERLNDISYGLKNLAKTHGWVVLVTNQATRQAEAREELKLSDSGYSYGFVQACDQVLMISGPSDGRENVRLVKLMKRRVGARSQRAVEITWDVDKGVIGG